MNTSVAGMKSNNEALLLRKVASLSAPVTTAHQTRNKTVKLRKNLERQVRNSKDEQSLQVFIRLMKASRFLDGDDATDEKRPMAPPASPMPNIDDDVIKTSSVRHRSSRTNISPRNETSLSTTLPSTVIVNAWADGNSSNSWLVMRGRNIRLQHQDHVKNALTTPRQVQSATCPSINRPMGHLHAANEFSSRAINRIVSVPVRSGRSSRNLLRNFTPTPNARSHLAFTTAAKKREWLRDKHVEPYCESRPVASVKSSDLNKSIVIKIPHLTRYPR